MENSCGACFLSWPEAFQAGVEAAGGKGWNLGRLDRYGFNVPAGGVLTAGAYQSFIEENNLLEAIEKITQSVNVDNIGDKDVEEEFHLIREKIKAGRISPYIQEELTAKLKKSGIIDRPLAVRSSATAEDSGKASFAGVHESFLNVRGLDNILSAIKGCYSSLWTPRAVAYRRKMNIRDGEAIPAVVIMGMVEAEAAGVGFTCDPSTGEEGVVLISANFGLGESVVNGAVEPDEYRLSAVFEIKQKRIGRKEGKTIASKSGGTEFVDAGGSSENQVLSDENMCKLGLLIQRVYEALGCGEQHQDIEWVFDGKDFVLVQARPVTVLPKRTYDELKDQPEIWSNANFRDALPMVQSTLNWSLQKQLWAMPANSLKDIGFQEGPTGLRMTRLYQGRAYFNLSMQQWIFYDAFGLTPRQVNEAMGGHQPEIEINEKSPYRGIKGCKRLWRLSRIAFQGLKTVKNAQKSFDKVDYFTKAILKENFNNLTDKEIISKFSEIINTYIDYLPVCFACNTTSNMNSLVKALEKSFPGKGQTYANALMSGMGDITSAQHGHRLAEMAEIARGDAAARSFLSAEPFRPLMWEKVLPQESMFKQALQDFLAEYGHRGVYEMDIINPRWREDPSYILKIVRDTMHATDTSKIKTRQKEKADEAWREVNRKVPFHRRGLVNYFLKQSVKGAELREMGKSVLAKIYESQRLLFQEIGRRLAGKGIVAEQADIYHCAWDEILSILKGDWNGRGLDILVAERKIRRKEMEGYSPPDFIIDEAPTFAKPATRNTGNALTGLGVAAGRASGAARLVCHPDEGEKLQAGDVMVVPSTDPGWTPLFLRASAIVMETGGSGSHGAIVAREYGIPAVVNISGVMKIIKDSQLITVDGDAGKVFLQN